MTCGQPVEGEAREASIENLARELCSANYDFHRHPEPGTGGWGKARLRLEIAWRTLQQALDGVPVEREHEDTPRASDELQRAEQEYDDPETTLAQQCSPVSFGWHRALEWRERADRAREHEVSDAERVLADLVRLYELKLTNPDAYAIRAGEKRAAWFKAKAILAAARGTSPEQPERKYTIEICNACEGLVGWERQREGCCLGGVVCKREKGTRFVSVAPESCSPEQPEGAR